MLQIWTNYPLFPMGETFFKTTKVFTWFEFFFNEWWWWINNFNNKKWFEIFIHSTEILVLKFLFRVKKSIIWCYLYNEEINGQIKNWQSWNIRMKILLSICQFIFFFEFHESCHLKGAKQHFHWNPNKVKRNKPDWPDWRQNRKIEGLGIHIRIK